MRRLLSLMLALLPLAAFAAPLRQGPPVQTGSWTHSELNDWLPGSFTNTFVDGSVVRLQDGQAMGEYLSAPLQAPFGFNAGVVEWLATVGPEQALTVEVRSSTDGQVWDEWRRASPTVEQGRALSQVFVFRLFTSYLQYRVGFTGTNGSPALDQITVTYIGSTAGPSLSEIVGRVPLAGPATLTPAPEAIARAEWAGAPPQATGEPQTPQRVELAQVLAPADDPNPLATLRALRWASQSLQGQAELPFHYLIDGQGNLFEGYGSVTRRIPGVAGGTVRLAVLANAEAEGVSEAAQARLIGLLAWLTASYGVPTAAVEAAADAPQRLKDVVDELRPAIGRAVVRSRTLFAAGSTDGATERVALFNPGATEARATLAAYLPGGEERRSVVVPAGQRVDVTLNTTLPTTTSLGLDIQADGPLLAERSMIVGQELLSSTGAATPARTWYFGEGSTVTDTQTLLLLLNPQNQEVSTTLTFYPDGTAPLTQTATLAPRSRTSLRLNDLVPNAQFGLKVVASQPVVAERSVFLAGGAAHLVTGVPQLSRSWSFAEGTTTDGVTTTLYLLNPWPQQVAVSLQVMSEDGTSLSRRYAVPAQSRFILTLNDVVPALPFAMQVQAERPVAAERVISFDGGAGATATAGAIELATRWTFVEGSTDLVDGTNEPYVAQFLLIANPHRGAVKFEVVYVLADGRREQRQYTVPSMARLTVSANADVPDQPVVTTIITASRPVVAERSIYVAGPESRGGETSVGVPGK